MVNLILKPANTYQRTKGYWKCNSNLLYSETFCQEIIAKINNMTEDSDLATYREKWNI